MALQFLTNFFKPIKFVVCNMDRENYHALLPNDILLLILNNIEDRLKLSLVSFQFYAVNRDFVSKCYHLHRYIPIMRSYIKMNDFAFNVISFNENNIALHQLKNITVDFSLSMPSTIDLLSLIDPSDKNVMLYHYQFCDHLQTINYFVDYESLLSFKEIIDFLPRVDDLTIKRITKVCLAFEQKILLGNPNIKKFISQWMDCFEDREGVIRLLNQFCYKKVGMDYESLLQQVDIEDMGRGLYQPFLTYFSHADTIYKNLTDAKHRVITYNNFTVSNQSVFFVNQRKTFIQLYKNTLPEHQWFYNQIQK